LQPVSRLTSPAPSPSMDSAAHSSKGDPANVVGLSLTVLRRLLADLGVSWTALWVKQR
jgi:hypothetical protein